MKNLDESEDGWKGFNYILACALALVVCSNENTDESFFYEEDLPATSPVILESPGGNYYRSPSLDGKRKGSNYLDLSYTHYDFNINTLVITKLYLDIICKPNTKCC